MTDQAEKSCLSIANTGIVSEKPIDMAKKLL
jgi:hypothetical protein